MRPRVKRLASGKLVLCVGLEGREEQGGVEAGEGRCMCAYS